MDSLPIGTPRCYRTVTPLPLASRDSCGLSRMDFPRFDGRSIFTASLLGAAWRTFVTSPATGERRSTNDGSWRPPRTTAAARRRETRLTECWELAVSRNEISCATN